MIQFDESRPALGRGRFGNWDYGIIDECWDPSPKPCR